jgi:hypothetical protein
VNINTAAHGTFWDTPRFTSTDDLLLSANQPVNKEYQRYPGHAAMTTLDLALPALASKPETIMALTPRYYTGGSTEGTVASNNNSTALGTPAKANRLYASVSELLFDPPPASGTRAPSANLIKKQVEAAKFFLTAHSRAPELNLFGLPRVAIWPISTIPNGGTATDYRTASDQCIAFCSTTQGSTPGQYYFTREPHTLLVNGGYVPALTGSNSSTTDVNLPRNAALLNYLDNLTVQPLPGNLSGGATFGGSKYTRLGMRQILTEIFDYIRITNARDPLLDPLMSGPTGGVPYSAANAISVTVPTGSQGDGQILPTYYAPWGTYGYGRFSGRVVEASLIFVGVGSPSLAVQPNQVATTSPLYTIANPTSKPPAGNLAVQAILVLNFFDPALGFNLANANFTITVAGLNTLTVNGSNVAFPATGTLLFQGPIGAYGGSPTNAGSILSWEAMVGGKVFARVTGAPNGKFPLYSNIFNVPNTSPTAANPMMTLGGGGLVTIKVYPQTANPATTPAVTPIHTFVLNLTSLNGAIPVPGLSARPLFGSVRTVTKTMSLTADRFDNYATNPIVDSTGQLINNFLDCTNDTVISLIPTAAYGDYRMLAPYSLAVTSASPLQAGSAFQPHPGYASLSATNRKAYGFQMPSGQVWHKST